MYGSVARGTDGPGSDLDIALVAYPEAAASAEYFLREALLSAEEAFVFHASVVALDTNDVIQLSSQSDPLWASLRNDAKPILGDSPENLLMRLARTTDKTAAT